MHKKEEYMKKKLLLIASMIAVIACLFAISVSAENNIIKLDTCPTLEEIHANPEAYVSHLDAFDGNSYGEIDLESVVVLSDLAETPTYYVFPSYYYVQSARNSVHSHLPALNAAIAAADSTAFADYKSIDGNYCAGSCKYLIRYEVPTYVTSIEARAKFESSSNLKEVYFPTKTVIDEETGEEKTVTYVTSVSGQNLFTSCTSLEYIHNMEYLPIGIVQGNNDGFASCNSLKEIKIPYGVTSVPGTCFKNCWAVKEVVLPNTVTYLGKGAFGWCKSLESFTFSENFTTFASPNNDYETFSGCNSLKFVYIPATLVDAMEARANWYKSIFGVSSKVVYFITGDEASATTIRDWFAVTKANDNIGNADMVAYDPSVDYVEYQASLTKSVIVYGYDYCLAFYGGEHVMTDDNVVNVNSYLEGITVCNMCTREGCGNEVILETIPALFESKGYSVKTYGDSVGISQGYEVNLSAIEAYKAYVPDFDFGIVAYANKNGGEVAPVPGVDGAIDISFVNTANAYVEVKVVGIPEGKYDVPIVFCVYTVVGGDYFYINNGAQSDTVVGISYNEALN